MILAPEFGIKRATRAQQQLMRIFLRDVDRLAKLMVPDLNKIWDEIAELVVAQFTDLFKSSGGHRVKAMEDEDSDRIMRNLALATIEDNLREIFERQYTRVMHSTIGTINVVFDLGVNLPDPTARAIIRQGGTRAGLLDVAGDTRAAIFRSLVDGRVLGEGQDAMARRIRSEVPAGRFTNAGPAYRSKLIARTETKFAQNVSAKASYIEMGASHVLAFDAQGAGESDPECEARNGQTFTIDQIDTELAEEHPNGTLSFAPVFNN